jgi:hypothetical protein
MRSHIAETDLALYCTRDLTVARRARVWLHIRGCESCRSRMLAYWADREDRRAGANNLPDGVDWDRLSAEMTANIHVGLAAGECVAPRSRKASSFWQSPAGPRWVSAWRPAAVVAGLAVLVGAAWWLNMPPSDTDALSRVMHSIIHGGRRGVLPEDMGPVVEATSAGVELRENGGALQVSQSGQRPLTVSVSAQGSASAHYIDTDTGQVTITSVYVQ